MVKICKLWQKHINYDKNTVNLNKTPLGETVCLGILLLTGGKAPRFIIHLLILTQSVRLPAVIYHSLCSTCVTYRTPCHATGHQLLPTHPYYSGKQRISMR